MPSYGHAVSTRDRLLTAPEPGKRKKSKQPLTGVVCLLTTGGLIRVRRLAAAQFNLFTPTATLECVAQNCTRRITVFRSPAPRAATFYASINLDEIKASSYKCRCRVNSEIMVAHRSRSAQGRVHFITTRLRKSLEYYSHVQYIFGTCTSGQADCHSVPGGMHYRRAKT